MTFLLAALLLMAAAVVGFITWRNAQPTSTVGQLLQRTEAGSGRSADAPGAAARPKS